MEELMDNYNKSVDVRNKLIYDRAIY